MKNKKYIIIISLLFVITTLFFTGGIYIYAGPKYNYDRSFEKIEQGKGFIPRHFHLVYNVTEIPLVPILFHVIYSKIPKDLSIRNYDPTYLERHKGFTRFEIEKLAIIYDNGKSVELISRENPESERVIQIPSTMQGAIIIKDAVKEKSSFKYHIEGKSFSEDGTPCPFKYVVKYKYSFGLGLGTRFQKWASI